MAEDLKKKAADEKAARDKVQEAQRERATGKPTPTQEELDAHQTGEPVTTHEADGSAVAAEPTTEEREKVQAEQRAKAAGKPTPTQKELDAANSGEPVKLEADGSTEPGEATKDLEPHKPGGDYRTRNMAAQQQPHRRTPTPAASE